MVHVTTYIWYSGKVVQEGDQAHLNIFFLKILKLALPRIHFHGFFYQDCDLIHMIHFDIFGNSGFQFHQKASNMKKLKIPYSRFEVFPRLLNANSMHSLVG